MISIMTWNILAENYVDFNNPKEYYNNIPVDDLKMRKRYPIIVQKLNGYSSDIIMLQEMTGDIRAKIVTDFSDKYRVSLFAKHDLGETKDLWYGNLTMVKRGVFSHVRHQACYLYKSGTVSLLTLCKHVPTGRNIIIVNIHLDAYNANVRKNEAHALVQYLKKWNKTHIIIIAGDFNGDETGLHKKFNDYGYTSIIKKKDSQSTYLCEDPMIDYIYAQGFDILGMAGCIDNVVYNKKNCMKKTLQTYGSDHHPVLARILFGV